MYECFACIYAIFYLSVYWLERSLKCGDSRRRVSYLWATMWVWGIEPSFFARIASLWSDELAVQWWLRLIILSTHEAKAEVHRIKDCPVSWWVHSNPEHLVRCCLTNKTGDMGIYISEWWIEPHSYQAQEKQAQKGQATVASHGNIWFKIQYFVKKSYFSRGSKVATD